MKEIYRFGKRKRNLTTLASKLVLLTKANAKAIVEETWELAQLWFWLSFGPD